MEMRYSTSRDRRVGGRENDSGEAGERFHIMVDGSSTGSTPGITDAIAADEHLRISEARYRTLVEAAPAHLVHCDAGGALTWVSPSLLAFTGLSASDLLGDLWKIAPAVHPDDRTALVKAWEESFSKKARMELEVRLRAHEGTYRWHLASISPVVLSDGTAAEWVGVATDIHALKEAEEKHVTELTHALRDAEDANRMRDRFLGMISHELRTPMTSIVGWTSLLSTGSVDAETMPLVLRSLQSSCRMLQKLVDDLLDLTRLMNDRIALHLRPLALNDVVREAVATILPAANQKGLTLRMSLPDAPVMIEGDSQRLHQVVANLLSNAVKFTDAGGAIDVSLEATESRIELTVRDTGKGISRDFLPFVFDRFSQEEKGGGLGLGLSIVRELVERHGGIISAHSEGPGCGASFIIRLPRDPGQA